MKPSLTTYIVFLVSACAISTFAQSTCDPKLELKAEEAVKTCNAMAKKAIKLWEDIDAAKKSIGTAIAKKDIRSLLPYVGCDASDSSRLEVICESDLPKIDIDALNKILERSKGRKTLEKSKWITTGINNDIFLLCANDYAFAATKNHCADDGKSQPVIEIRKSKAGFYIFGVPLSGT